MNDEYSYVGVPATTQEAMAEEDHDHPVELSETHTLQAGSEAPAAPKLSAPMVEWKSLVTPIGTLIFAAVLAVGHHAFNHWAASPGKTVAQVTVVIPQHWVTRIGVGFSFGFKSAVGVTMGFVLLQCLWLAVARQPLTIQQIDTMYRIERQDQLYKTLPQALSFSPTIVIFSALMLLLPLPGVFAPGSLTVVPENFTNVPGNCTIPTGNLLNSGSFSNGPENVWTGITPKATQLTRQWFMEQHIPDLPQACGPNCRYKVHIPSSALQCTPNPSSLPNGQSNWNSDSYVRTLWNGTAVDLLGFYIAWQSNDIAGTSGNAFCSFSQAHYDIEVQTKAGAQSVKMNVTQMISPIPDFTDLTNLNNVNISSDMVNFWMQLGALSVATQNLFLGHAVYVGPSPGKIGPGPTVIPGVTGRFPNSWVETNLPGFPSFLDIPDQVDESPIFVWGDVLKGIEEMSHNVTAALLTLQLGTMDSTCLFDQLNVQIYQYSSLDLWAPYGTALGVALISLVFAIMIMARNNTGHITTSFSDTAILAKIVDEDVPAGAKLRLAEKDGKLQYTLEETDGTSEYGRGKVDGLLKSMA